MIHLDFLPDGIYITIYKYVMDIAIRDAVHSVLRKNLPVCGNKTNSRVVYSWMNGKPFKSLSMRTDGKNLYSYALKIGTTTDDQCKNVLDYTAKGLMFYSVTTSTHVGLAKKHIREEIYRSK
jgi:hypothetical protein